MRVLHLTHYLDVGGSTTMMLELAAQQQELGLDVTVASIGGDGPMDEVARKMGLPLDHLYVDGWHFAQIYGLTRYLQKNRFDVVHSHWGIWIAAAIAGWLTNTVCVHTHHGNQRRIWIPRSWIAKHFTEKVVCLTPEIDDYIAKWVRVPAEKVRVIPNGVELSRLDSAERIELDGIPVTAPVIGMVARLSAPKDYSTLIEAARILAPRHPEVHFIAVGDGPHRQSLEEQARDLKNFHFLGARSDVPSIFRRMQINVLSTCSEGHSITLLEALASGCATIASNIPANRFALDEGRCGLLPSVGSSAELATAIERLLEDPVFRASLVNNGRKWVQRFSVENMARSYIELYRELVPESK